MDQWAGRSGGRQFSEPVAKGPGWEAGHLRVGARGIPLAMRRFVSSGLRKTTADRLTARVTVETATYSMYSGWNLTWEDYSSHIPAMEATSEELSWLSAMVRPSALVRFLQGL